MGFIKDHDREFPGLARAAEFQDSGRHSGGNLPSNYIVQLLDFLSGRNTNEIQTRSGGIS
jgi:hypothetical protein